MACVSRSVHGARRRAAVKSVDLRGPDLAGRAARAQYQRRVEQQEALVRRAVGADAARRRSACPPRRRGGTLCFRPRIGVMLVRWTVGSRPLYSKRMLGAPCSLRGRERVAADDGQVAGVAAGHPDCQRAAAGEAVPARSRSAANGRSRCGGSRRGEEALVGDAVLVVAQDVAHVGEQLEQDVAEVGLGLWSVHPEPFGDLRAAWTRGCCRSRVRCSRSPVGRRLGVSRPSRLPELAPGSRCASGRPFDPRDLHGHGLAAV